MRAAGRRMTREAHRHEGDQRTGQQRRRPPPTQHRKAGQCDRGRDERGPAPRGGGVDEAGRRPDADRIEVFAQRVSRDIRHRQWHQQRRTHRPHGRRGRAEPERAVAGGVEHPVGLRRYQKRREQERPRRQHGGDLPRRPHERQPVGGRRPRIGQPGGGERVGQRERADACRRWRRRALRRRSARAIPRCCARSGPPWSCAQGMACCGRHLEHLPGYAGSLRSARHSISRA